MDRTKDGQDGEEKGKEGGREGGKHRNVLGDRQRSG